MRDNKYTILESYVKSWTFLTNHAQVLICLAETHDIRLRDVAERIGITERATQRILADLVEAGYSTQSASGEATTTPSTTSTPCATPPRSATKSAPWLTAPSTDSVGDSSSDTKLKPNA